MLLDAGEVLHVTVAVRSQAGSRKKEEYEFGHYRPVLLELRNIIPRKSILVSRNRKPRLVDGIQILPWTVFLEKLWGNDLL